jgi:hypothetical protein
MVVFADPFALILAAAGGWLTVISVMGLGHLLTAGVGSNLVHLMSCTAYVAVLGFITTLALAHILITGLAGWGTSVRADSAPATSAGRPGPGRGS